MIRKTLLISCAAAITLSLPIPRAEGKASATVDAADGRIKSLAKPRQVVLQDFQALFGATRRIRGDAFGFVGLLVGDGFGARLLCQHGQGQRQ